MIFPHDGDGNFDLTHVSVLDTELLTLRVCGDLIAPNHPVDLPKCTFVTVGFK